MDAWLFKHLAVIMDLLTLGLGIRYRQMKITMTRKGVDVIQYVRSLPHYSDIAILTAF